MLCEPWERLIHARLIPHILRQTPSVGKGRFSGGRTLETQAFTWHRFGVCRSRKSGSIEGRSAAREVRRRSSLLRPDCTAEGALPQHADGSTLVDAPIRGHVVVVR